MGSEGGCIHCGSRADCTTEMYGKVWRAGGNESLCIAVSEIKIGMIVRRVALELLDFGSNGVVKFSNTSAEKRTAFLEMIHK